MIGSRSGILRFFCTGLCVICVLIAGGCGDGDSSADCTSPAGSPAAAACPEAARSIGLPDEPVRRGEGMQGMFRPRGF